MAWMCVLERLGAVGRSGGCSQGLAAAPGLSGWAEVGGPHNHADVQQMRLKKMDYLT